MKKTTRFISLLALVLAVTVLFAGCSTDGILSLLSIDASTYDPATEMVADMSGKTVESTGNTFRDFTYTLYTDGTASVSAYSGKEASLSIPAEIESHTVIGLENKGLYANAALEELVLPDCLEYVGNYALMKSEKLEKVTFGKNIKIIGVSAFDCSGDNGKSEGYGSLTEIVWKGSPDIIRENAFNFCSKLTEIVIPDGCREINNWAFAKCFNAKRIILGEGLEKIGDHAFLKCRSAVEVVIPSTCKTVEISAFYQCKALSTLVIAEGVETLEKGAFEECESLKSVVLPSTIKALGNYAFYNCLALEKVQGGSDGMTIGDDVFKGDEKLAEPVFG